jgi:thioredoxin-dependent peroxiredoxin
MNPSLNAIAPEFEVQDIYDQKIRPSNFKGKKLLLSFYRNVACPFCNLRVYQLSKLAQTFKEHNLELIFVFETPKAHILRSSFHSGMSPIPIIADPDLVLYEQYGIEKSKVKVSTSMFKTGFLRGFTAAKQLGVKIDTQEKENFTLPADFLINEEGKIVQIHYGSSVQDNIPLAEIKAFAGM